MQQSLKQRLSIHGLLYTNKGIQATAEFLRTTGAVQRARQENRDLEYGWGTLGETNDED
jgi:hypothetical protein